MDARPQTAIASAASEFGSIEVTMGNVGDHGQVGALLRACGHAHSADDFASWLDEPSYEPADRLVVRQHGRIIAHAQLLFRSASFAGVKVPMAGLIDLAALVEYQATGLEGQVLSAAERMMRDEGTVVSLLRTDRPETFATAGWTAVAAQGYSQANSRGILSHLTAQSALRRRDARQFHVRLWRQFELDALMPVYRAGRQWGTVVRSEPYWHWLMARESHDKVIVAIDGPSPVRRSDSPPDEPGIDPEDIPVPEPPRIVAYAVLQGSRVIELCWQPGGELAATLVLARACRDAIEQDHHSISLHTAASDPFHEVLVTAGGTWCPGGHAGEDILMAKLLDPVRWIESLYPVLLDRARQSDIKRPCVIQFEVDGQPIGLHLTRRSSRLEFGSPGPVDARCDRATFGALLLGDVSAASLVESGHVSASGPEAAERLAGLFPAECLWQSPFDLLRF